MRDYDDHFQAFARAYPDLATGLHGVRGLGGLMEWMKPHGLRLDAVDILNQDEFNVEFMILLGDGRHLVFGVT